MTELRVVTLAEATGLNLPWPDFYFTPGYGAACEHSDGGRWHLAFSADEPILYPFLLRPIPNGNGLVDLTSPYGYPGVWAPQGTPLSAWHSFRQQFRDWATAHGAVSEFFRFSGLVPGRESLLAADPGVLGREHNQTIAIDTSRGYDAAWDGFESRARTKVRKARKLGFTGRWHRAAADDMRPGAPFRDLYAANMHRIEAAPYYLFSDAFFSTFVERLEVHLLEILDADGRVVASGMVLPFGELCHLHLVGTEDGANRQGVGPLIYDEATRWAADRQHRLLHIGGGLKAGDSLFYFKSGFGGTVLPYWIGTSVLDQGRYDALTLRHAEALGVGPGAPALSYFPTYRAPAPRETAASSPGE